MNLFKKKSKKSLVVLMVAVLCFALCACGGNTDSGNEAVGANNGTLEKTDEKIDETTFPFVGTWTTEEKKTYLRIEEGGTITAESILVSSTTSTVNGVTTKKETKKIVTNTYTWSVSDGKFMFNNKAAYEPCVDNGTYSLVGEKTTYFRIGELDYVIPLEDKETEQKDLYADAVDYVVGDVIVAEGLELVFDEIGVKDDIRISSKSSGIQITSGPSEEEGKQYVYLKGALKNTGTTATRATIGGVVYLDEYEFALKTDTIKTSGSPSSSIDPLETVHIILYAQISDEMADIFTEGKIIFGFNDNFSEVELENAQYLYCAKVEG